MGEVEQNRKMEKRDGIVRGADEIGDLDELVVPEEKEERMLVDPV